LAVRGVLSDNDAPLVSWTSLRLNFDVELGSTLQVDTDFDLTGSNPTLSLKGTLIAQSLNVWDHGTITVE
jgi:hypothetical protein